MIEHLVLLSKNKDKPPEIRDKPSINWLIASISSHQNLRHIWQQSFQTELLQVFGEYIFINVNYLIAVVVIDLDHLVSEIHCLAVGVLDALFYVV
jgi:hypothetical protein